ncbi:hypothetical protein Aab01nite_49520 [Paractinoplanes abujensis]|uniref:WXG100 family type VII secretion target n=1 Tax=Paractinoplanes abujensis TaxID=882441 RepID=A0A7W7CVX8_9ACTN|nr:WXG100 family type VII secretion target [Actinoplanes abujensis]MBB4693981.1 WXG100 family type VII secretion target [Actinoplanes abujensis]GID21362.1 hypothetical protein Aab01nite_49520 [Actinoplanes abujensis]
MTDVPVNPADAEPPQTFDYPGFPHFDAGQLRAAAAVWTNVANGLRSMVEATQAQILGVGDAWTGSAQAAFVAEWTTMAGGVHELCAELDSAAADVRQLADDLEEQREKVKSLLEQIGATLVIGVAVGFVTAGLGTFVTAARAAQVVNSIRLILIAVRALAVRLVLRTVGTSLKGIAARFVVNAGFEVAPQVGGNLVEDWRSNPFRDISPKDVTITSAVSLLMPFHGKGKLFFRGAANNVTAEAVIELYRDRKLDPGHLVFAGALGGISPVVGSQISKVLKGNTHANITGAGKTPKNEPDTRLPEAKLSASGQGRALSPAERDAVNKRLREIEQRYPDEFDRLSRDPDGGGRISSSSQDEARIGLDLREQKRLPEDLQRPTERGKGDFFSPSTGEYYDVKGLHSDWPPGSTPKDPDQLFPQAVDPVRNPRVAEDFVKNLESEITGRGRKVIIDTRNANIEAIDFIKGVADQKGWGGNVIWYP